MINTILNAVTQYWLPLVCGAGGALLLYLIGKLLKLIARRTDPVYSGPAPGTVLSRPSGTPHRSTPRSTGRPPADLERDRQRSIVSDLKEDNARLRTRIQHLTQMNSILAPLIKELNANVDRRRMGPLVMRVLKRIFSPRQALVFFSDGEEAGLSLVAHHGVEGISDGFRLAMGEGFAGVVAKKKVTLTRDAFRHESNLIRKKVKDTEPAAFQTEVATPILYRGAVLGVLCMGGAKDLTEDQLALFGMIGDITALALTNYIQYRKIQELANSDPLTRIYNKGYFLSMCDHELAAADKAQRPMSVLMLDVDHFKHYNDTNGHLAGDRLLKELADLLKGMVREQDTVARFGGEEFVVLLHGVTGREALPAAERIREAVAKHPFPQAWRQPLGCVSVCVGAACMPDHGRDTHELIERADEALYAAKKAGRNRVAYASDKVEVITF